MASPSLSLCHRLSVGPAHSLPELWPWSPKPSLLSLIHLHATAEGSFTHSPDGIPLLLESCEDQAQTTLAGLEDFHCLPFALLSALAPAAHAPTLTPEHFHRGRVALSPSSSRDTGTVPLYTCSPCVHPPGEPCPSSPPSQSLLLGGLMRSTQLAEQLFHVRHCCPS